MKCKIICLFHVLCKACHPLSRNLHHRVPQLRGVDSGPRAFVGGPRVLLAVFPRPSGRKARHAVRVALRVLRATHRESGVGGVLLLHPRLMELAAPAVAVRGCPLRARVLGRRHVQDRAIVPRAHLVEFQIKLQQYEF